MRPRRTYLHRDAGGTRRPEGLGRFGDASRDRGYGGVGRGVGRCHDARAMASLAPLTPYRRRPRCSTTPSAGHGDGGRLRGGTNAPNLSRLPRPPLPAKTSEESASKIRRPRPAPAQGRILRQPNRVPYRSTFGAQTCAGSPQERLGVAPGGQLNAEPLQHASFVTLKALYFVTPGGFKLKHVSQQVLVNASALLASACWRLGQGERCGQGQGTKGFCHRVSFHRTRRLPRNVVRLGLQGFRLQTCYITINP